MKVVDYVQRAKREMDNLASHIDSEGDLRDYGLDQVIAHATTLKANVAAQVQAEIEAQFPDA